MTKVSWMHTQVTSAYQDIPRAFQTHSEMSLFILFPSDVLVLSGFCLFTCFSMKDNEKHRYLQIGTSTVVLTVLPLMFE